MLKITSQYGSEPTSKGMGDTRPGVISQTSLASSVNLIPVILIVSLHILTTFVGVLILFDTGFPANLACVLVAIAQLLILVELADGLRRGTGFAGFVHNLFYTNPSEKVAPRTSWGIL